MPNLLTQVVGDAARFDNSSSVRQ